MPVRYFTLYPDKAYPGPPGWMISMLQYTRANTIKLVTPLTDIELDTCLPNHNNSIGSLLLHIAAMERNTQCITCLGRDMNSAERKRWKHSMAGNMDVIIYRNKTAGWYTGLLRRARTRSLAMLKGKNAAWLKQFTRPYKNTSNGFLWFHLMEDELCHQGQIKSMIRHLKKIPASKSRDL